MIYKKNLKNIKIYKILVLEEKMKLYYVDFKNYNIYVFEKCYQNLKVVESLDDIDVDKTIYIPDVHGHKMGLMDKEIFYNYKNAKEKLNNSILMEIDRLEDKIINKDVIITIKN